MNKLIFNVVGVANVAVAFLIGCGGSDDTTTQPDRCGSDGYTGSYGSVPYNGKTYKTVEIGNQTWFAENLNYAVEGSECYDYDQANCVKYGRLYDWKTALTACPAGWHIPNDYEWDVLVNYAGGSSKAGKKLKSTSGWDDNGCGTDNYGFSALPGGHYDHGCDKGANYGNCLAYRGALGMTIDGGFSGVYLNGNWWSATENDYTSARVLELSSYDDDYESVWRYAPSQTDMFSIRCVKDN